jgi:hypothetical protein
MKYLGTISEKKESDRLILKEIAKNRGYSGKTIDYVGNILAERIEIIENNYKCYSKLEQETTKLKIIADYLPENKIKLSSMIYNFAGNTFLGLAGKLNDEKLAEKAKDNFLSASIGYKKLAEITNHYEKEEYEYLSKECNFLSENSFRLNNILAHYYKLQKKADDIIKETTFKSFINFPIFMNKILDNINILKELDPSLPEFQKIRKIIEQDSCYLSEEKQSKIILLMNKILSDKKN